MAIRGITLSSVETFTPDSDPDKGTDRATSFTLKPLDGFLNAYIWDAGLTVAVDGNRLALQRMSLEAVRFGVVGWDNFLDANGSPIAFKTESRIVCGRAYQGVTDELLAQLPFVVMKELADRIREMATVSEDEAKN